MVPRENVRGGMGDTIKQEDNQKNLREISHAAALNNLVKRREEEQEV